MLELFVVVVVEEEEEEDRREPSIVLRCERQASRLVASSGKDKTLLGNNKSNSRDIATSSVGAVAALLMACCFSTICHKENTE